MILLLLPTRKIQRVESHALKENKWLIVVSIWCGGDRHNNHAGVVTFIERSFYSNILFLLELSGRQTHRRDARF